VIYDESDWLSALEKLMLSRLTLRFDLRTE